MSNTAPTPTSNFENLIFRRTNQHLGRHISVSPSNSSMRHLQYGRIILRGSKKTAAFSTGDRETGLICLSGSASVAVDGKTFELGTHDAIYIPRDSAVEVDTNSETDFAEFSAEVQDRYPLQVVRYAELEKDPGLKFSTGGPGCKRELHMVLAKNIEAGRLIAGFTISDPGNWIRSPFYVSKKTDLPAEFLSQHAALERFLRHTFEVDVGNRPAIVDRKTVYIFESPA